MRFHFVLLTKCYDKYDIIYWFDYHRKKFPNAVFHIFDNESYIDIRATIDPSLYTYNRIVGFPDQKKLYADIMNGKYGEFFENNDMVAFIDDDEYLYVKDKNCGSYSMDIVDVAEKCSEEYDTLCLPHINTSSKELMEDRDTSKSMPSILTYRRDDKEATVKCIVKYKAGSKYEWKSTDNDSAGHVPYIDGVRNACVFTGWIRKNPDGSYVDGKAEVLTYPLNTSIATIDFTSNIRLYHYHLKSRWDWSEKIDRGSCARRVPWYPKEVEKNMFYGKYDVLDEDMKNEFESIVNPVGRMDGLLHDEYKIVSENDTTRRKAELGKKNSADYESIRFADTFDEKLKLGKLWIEQNAPHINLTDPQNLCDWIGYYKLYDLNPLKITWSDKCAVYKALYDTGLDQIRIPVMYEKYKPTDDDIREAVQMCMKNDCILKCNHGSGYNIRFKAGEPVNVDYMVQRIRSWLDTNYAYVAGYEWQYEPIVPAIIVQPALFSSAPVDYQFFCHLGKVVAVELQKKVSKVIIEHISFTDTDGNDLPWYIGSKPLQRGLNDFQKEAVKMMLPAVEKIANQFKFVRVDMMKTAKQVYFCEATFCPSSGVLDYREKE